MNTGKYLKYLDEKYKACRVEGEYIILSNGNDDADYDVSLSKCNSHSSILGWVNHLSEKKWITILHLRQFIFLSCEYHDLDAHNTN